MNSPKSIRAKLMNVSKASGVDFQSIITRYIHERILYRISKSEYRDKFILKGGNLLYAHFGLLSRPTTDIDFSGQEISNQPENLVQAFTTILTIHSDDALIFEGENISIQIINEDHEYQGCRLIFYAKLDTIKQQIKIDVGFGDVIVPEPDQIHYPVLLSFLDEPILNAYTIETVIAEKLHAILFLGELSSRMKDFYDIYTLVSSRRIDSTRLKNAIEKTFENRNFKPPKSSIVFESSFVENVKRLKMWETYLRKLKIQHIEFYLVVKNIQQLYASVTNSEKDSF
jgi:predicted nucleotidyltransferase component of viral defense system